jgi:diguanylate cyclase (GGDEF)-like protein
MNLFPRDARTPKADTGGRAESGGGPQNVPLPAVPAPLTVVPDQPRPATPAIHHGRPDEAGAHAAGAHAAGAPGSGGPMTDGGGTPPSARVSPPDPYEDLLTGLVGPAVWRRVLTTESARVVRYRRSVTILLVEIAGLDTFARRWGAETAANGVIAVSRALRAGSRAADYLARLEIGTFGLVLDQADEIAAINAVERLREAIQYELRGAEDDLKIGFGWASPTPGESLLDTAERASARLRLELHERRG